MAAGSASFAILGIPPGSDRAAIDRAYRALMKRHHPDRGGDPAQAAAINRAYAEITRPVEEPEVPPPGDLAAALFARQQLLRREAQAVRRRRSKWPLWLAALVLVAALGWVQREALADTLWNIQWRYFAPGGELVADEQDLIPMGSDAPPVTLGAAPLDAAILASADEAARLSLKRGGMGGAADASRKCYMAFHQDPTLAAFDRCVAFDNAVVLIGGHGSADRGGFSAGSVTGRQIQAARMLDRDYESIENRLDRLRLAMMRMMQAQKNSDTEAAPVAAPTEMP